MVFKHSGLRPVGIAIKVFTVVLALVLIDHMSGALTAMKWVIGDAGANVALVFAFWTTLLAPGFYLIALWSLGNFFSRGSSPEVFSSEASRCIRSTGSSLLTGAGCALMVEPLAIATLTAEGMHFDVTLVVEDLTIGLIGLALYVLVASAEQLRDELKEFI